MASSSDHSSQAFANELSPGAVYLFAVEEDLQKASKIKSQLEREGLKAWHPALRTDESEEEVADRLWSCSVFLPILTSHSLDDPAFIEECQLALKLLDEFSEDDPSIQICPIRDAAAFTNPAQLINDFGLRNILFIDSANGDIKPDDLEVIAQLYDRWHERRIAEESEAYEEMESGGKVYAGKSIDPQAGELVDLLKENEMEETAAISVLSDEELSDLKGEGQQTPDLDYSDPVQEEPDPEPEPTSEDKEAEPETFQEDSSLPEEEKPNYPPEGVQFTTYRPKHLQTTVWTPLLVFTHLDDKPTDAPADSPHPIEEVQNQAERILGERASDYNQVTKDSRMEIPREAEISLIPKVDGVQFNPPERRFFWSEGILVHREEFGVKAKEDVVGQSVRPSISAESFWQSFPYALRRPIRLRNPSSSPPTRSSHTGASLPRIPDRT